MRLNTPILDVEYLVAEGKTIVSTTDLQGNITYANTYFVEASGYPEEELIGAPQNILRHPDMPASAFKDLWLTIRAGLPWRGLVKNRRKNGEYYWVMANVTPVIENGKAIGYMSVRTKPTRQQVDLATKLYAQERARPGSVKLCQGQPTTSTWYDGSFVQRFSMATRTRVIMVMLLASVAAAGAASIVAEGPWWSGALAGFGLFLAASVWIYLEHNILKPIKEALHVAQCIAGGDLTSRLETRRTDEIGQLMRAMAQLNTNLHSIVGDVRNNFNDILNATAQLAGGTRDLSARTDSQAAALEETAASMEELTSAVKQNADNSQNGDRFATQALQTAEKGNAIVGNVVSTIAEISDSSNRISDIVGIINGIAYQTNLLSGQPRRHHADASPPRRAARCRPPCRGHQPHRARSPGLGRHRRPARSETRFAERHSRRSLSDHRCARSEFGHAGPYRSRRHACGGGDRRRARSRSRREEHHQPAGRAFRCAMHRLGARGRRGGRLVDQGSDVRRRA